MDNSEQKLKEIIFLLQKYNQLTPIGVAVTGFTIITKIDSIVTSMELTNEKEVELRQFVTEQI